MLINQLHLLEEDKIRLVLIAIKEKIDTKHYQLCLNITEIKLKEKINMKHYQRLRIITLNQFINLNYLIFLIVKQEAEVLKEIAVVQLTNKKMFIKN